MTYEESYMLCETLQELRKEMLADLIVASHYNTDRIDVIYESGQKVIDLKFKQEV